MMMKTVKNILIRAIENEKFTDILLGRNRNSCRKRMQRKSASGITGKNRNAWNIIAMPEVPENFPAQGVQKNKSGVVQLPPL